MPVKRWHAPRTLATILPIVVALGLGALAVAAALPVVRATRGPIDAWTIDLRLLGYSLVLLIAAGGALAAAWRAIRNLLLVYELDRNAIVVHYPGSRYTIPLDQIVSITNAEAARRRPALRFGHGAPNQTLLIETQRRYALAIAERDDFARELAERLQLGPTREQREGVTSRSQPLTQFIAAARWLLALGIVLNLAVWALLVWRYALLPDTVPIRFDPLGGTQGTRTRTYTLLLPGVATLVWFGNAALAALLQRRARLASDVLLVGAIIVQLMSLAAVWFLVSGVEQAVGMLGTK
jgi:hypothetical protein